MPNVHHGRRVVNVKQIRIGWDLTVERVVKNADPVKIVVIR